MEVKGYATRHLADKTVVDFFIHEVVINGLHVPSTVAIAVNDSAKKIKIKASQTDLNLQSGTNQVQVIVGGVRSNTFTFVL